MLYQSFIIEGVDHGRSPRPPFISGGIARAIICDANSLVFICPTCGRAWASCPVDGREFYAQRARCKDHPNPIRDWGPSGSLWDWDEEFVKSFPPEVVRREFWLHLEHLENGVKHGT